MSTRWWLLVDHCVLRNWDRILVRAVKVLISRVGMVSICPLLWQRDVELQQTKFINWVITHRTQFKPPHTWIGWYFYYSVNGTSIIQIYMKLYNNIYLLHTRLVAHANRNGAISIQFVGAVVNKLQCLVSQYFWSRRPRCSLRYHKILLYWH